jgi:hypothetical protein
VHSLTEQSEEVLCRRREALLINLRIAKVPGLIIPPIVLEWLTKVVE